MAVNDCNIEIGDGEFIVFVGPSGCGKSTTLRMIAGLEEISSGELYIGDRLVNNVEPKDRDIAMVFQSYALFPHMTAFENIAFGLKMRKVPFKVLNPETNMQYKELKKKSADKDKAVYLLDKQIKQLNSMIKKAEKSGETDVADLQAQIIGKKEEITVLQKELAEVGKQMEELIENAEPVLKIDGRKLRALKAQLREAKQDFKLCETDEETQSVTERVAGIQKEIEYYSATPVTAYTFKHLPKNVIREKVNKAAQILEISELLDIKPRAMSGGQRQRIALGRAIVREPKVMLLDEPLSNLDAKLRASMRAEIVKLHNSLKTTFIYVTHDQIEAMTMGTRIVVMKNGVVQQVDTPVRLFDYPANKFVAGFIGTPQMNFFKVKIRKSADGLAVKFENGEEKVFDLTKLRKIDKSYLDGQPHDAIFGIRGENIFVDKNGIKVTLTMKEILGNTTQLFVRLTPDGDDVIICTGERNDYMPGDAIGAGFSEKHIHLFDSESEKAIMLDS